MLMKPDRKYKHSKFYLTHIYYVHDFMKKLLAVAMLEEDDFREFVDPQEDVPQTPENSDTMQSRAFKKLRDNLIQQVEQNDFLYSLLRNPEEHINTIDVDQFKEIKINE